MKKLLFASGNRGKLRDLNAFLAGSDIQVISPEEFSESSGKALLEGEVEETGATYEENAKIKSLTLFQWAKIPTLADDSGLEVEALNGAPGLYSARYAGVNVSFDQNIDKLLSELQGASNRSAKFISVLSLTLSPLETVFFRGELDGQITTSRRGSGGFGYDPVFEVGGTGKTLAELKAETGKIDTHRTRALRLLEQYLSTITF